MAAYKVIHKPEIYQTPRDVVRVIRYATSSDKAREAGVIGGAVLPENAAEAMNIVTDVYYNESGPRIRHSVLSFSPLDRLTFGQVKGIAKSCINFYKDRYQILAAVHEDRFHLHIHFVMNTTSYVDGSKYQGTKSDYYGCLKHIRQVLKPHGIDVKPVKNQESEKA